LLDFGGQTPIGLTLHIPRTLSRDKSNPTWISRRNFQVGFTSNSCQPQSEWPR